MPLLSFPRPRVPRSQNQQQCSSPLDFAPPIKPRPTIAALLRVPRATACVFAVYESYREKDSHSSRWILALLFRV
ncbi:hypothetical protein B0H13DRAFT_2347762 [Mycena leptocephala]|nr:hypothetical protein B0H13DRAFT_2347762 [Mycena leptocephala]